MTTTPCEKATVNDTAGSQTAPSDSQPPAKKHDVPRDSVLLLNNLRCLDLDLLPDWPLITAHTFSTKRKGVALTQKDCLRAAEWVLYRLFELWDPVETRNRLLPFFPVLEPLQSIKLRAELYQLLSQLKSTSLLPRECALRKSMMDECAGERFEELLFAFSAVVLQKKIRYEANTRRVGMSIAEQISTAPELHAEDMDLAEGLLLAHKNSLHKSITQRRETRVRLKNLEGQLQDTMTTLETRCTTAEAQLAAIEPRLTQLGIDTASMEGDLRDVALANADNGWLDIITTGDATAAQIDFLEADFDELWTANIAHNKPYTGASRPASLLEVLQTRVAAQQHRVAEMRAFQASMNGKNEETMLSMQSPSKKSPVKSPLKTPRKTQRLRNVHDTPSARKALGQQGNATRVPVAPMVLR